jgi:peptide-methionine (S)-S-oxide reductase
MSLFDKKNLVTQSDALPGRNTPMPVARYMLLTSTP